jgi:hypothetical protein
MAVLSALWSPDYPLEVTRMNATSFPILDFSQVTPRDFVRFWQPLYTYSADDEGFYRENIGKELTPDRIKKWFAWKNTMPLSARKEQTVLRHFSPEERIGHDADVATLLAFLNRPGGVIWRTFWLHLLHSEHFPIYDQHVHRAMAFMLNWPKLEIPVHGRTKARNYLEFYRPFFARFGDCDHRQVDQALWSFGIFLKSKYGAHIRRNDARQNAVRD